MLYKYVFTPQVSLDSCTVPPAANTFHEIKLKLHINIICFNSRCWSKIYLDLSLSYVGMPEELITEQLETSGTETYYL